MATYDYQALQDNVARPLILRFGTTVTLERIDDTVTYVKKYDPVQGRNYWENQSDLSVTYTQPGETMATYTGLAVITNYKDDDIDGTDILSSDRKILALDIPEPTHGDRITIEGTTYEYVNHKSIAPSGFAVIYKIQVRI